MSSCETQVREMRKTRNGRRRGEALEHEQPAEKRRKTGEEKWLNVKQEIRTKTNKIRNILAKVEEEKKMKVKEKKNGRIEGKT